MVRKSSAFNLLREKSKKTLPKINVRKTSILQLKRGITDDGEAYLFHGTLLENAVSIVDNGFDVGKSEGGLYGKGIYLAESSQKADQYTDDLNDRRPDFLTMFLVRTSLGRVERYRPKGNPPELRRDKTSLMIENFRGVNTLVGGSNKRFREFIKNTADDCYPQFLIVYNRVKHLDNA